MLKEQRIAAFFEKHPELKLKRGVIDKLIGEAKRMRETAYVPYSDYKVGAAVLCQSDEIYGGCNVENVAYTLSAHAEQVAILRAAAAGEIEKSGRKFIKALVVVHEGNSMPCGLCRQIIQEFCDDALIINTNVEGKILGISSLSTLLPKAFGPTHLGIE